MNRELWEYKDGWLIWPGLKVGWERSWIVLQLASNFTFFSLELHNSLFLFENYS